jgi:transposase
LIEERDCEFIYPPPYSPDLNLIEETFPKIKHFLRKIGARGKGALIKVMGEHREP